MRHVLAIDPGPTESAYALIAHDTRRPLEVGKVPNDDVPVIVSHRFWPYRVAIEMVSSYGMAVGADVFVTCVWIGRFLERVRLVPAELVYRRDVKLHHCGSARAKDANITQALIDRFAPGEPNRGKGTKKAPGWFHGFSADIWQAYALAVYVADIHEMKAAG
jgi:hypothetical protein